MLVDTHAHLYSEEFDQDRAEVMARAEASGVVHTIMPSISMEEYPRLIAALREFPSRVSAALGLHPAYVKEDYREQLQFIEAKAYAEDWVAIGEIGLDYYWSTGFKAEQHIALREQLRLALRLDLPVIIHVRNAFEDLVGILEEEEFVALRGVIHSFTGTEEELQSVLRLHRFMIALNGVVTFKNASLREYITQIPLDRLLVETDAPYLAPIPQRGKRNEPAFVAHTASYLAELWQLSLDTLASITSDNARRLFRL